MFVRILVAFGFGFGSHACAAQGPVPTTVRVVALDEDGKPVARLSAADINATAAGKPVTVLQLSSYAASGANAGGRNDSLLYLFSPMQANETAQRAKAIQPVSGLLNPTLTIVTGDGAQVTGPAGSAQINATIDRLTGKKVTAESFSQWQPIAMKAIRAGARATGRCIVVLSDSKHHLPPNIAGYDMTSISSMANNLACELYVVEDAADMPSEIPPTIGQVRRGQVLDASGHLVDVVIGANSLPVSASGEQVAYSMKSAIQEIQRDAMGVYWAELAIPAACQRPPGCPLLLSTSRKNVSLHFPRQVASTGSRHSPDSSASRGN